MDQCCASLFSNDFFNLCCTPCGKKKKNRSALKYCVSCKEYFCVTCVENHNSFQAMSGHLLVNPYTLKSSPSLTGRKQFHEIPTELCQHHPMEVVNMYCGKEDIVGCSVCFTFNHRSCDDIHYIPEYVKSNFQAEQVNRINNDLTEAIKLMKKLKTQLDRLDSHLDQSKANCKQGIQRYRKEINKKIDKIEADTLSELDVRHKDKRNNTHDTNPLDVHDKMLRFKYEIESDQSNEAQKFVIAKLSQGMIKQGRELQSKLSNDQTNEFTFIRNTDIMTFLLSIVTLGMLSPPVMQDFSLQTLTACSKQISTKCTTSSLASTDSSKETGVCTKQETRSKMNLCLYNVLDKSEYNIKQQEDKSECDIMSSCLLDNGNILLADFSNNKLKLVDSRTYSVRSSLPLNASPWSVCRVSSTEAAVCLDGNSIQFVSTSLDELVPVRSISMEHYCKCIAVIGDKMYVGGGRYLYIYLLNGKHVHTISTDKLKNIWDITVSDDEMMIHIADSENSVITLNTDGTAVWRYSGTELREAWGVCTDGNGNVIVSGAISNNVIQLGPDGQYIGNIVSGSDWVISPCTVCYDRNTHKLIVGQSNSIIVFTVQ